MKEHRMKNNLTLFLVGLSMLSASSFASKPALTSESEQIEGQPGAPGGLCFAVGSASASSSSTSSSDDRAHKGLSKLYREQSTQTELSGDQTDILAVTHALLADTDALHVKRVNAKLSEIKDEAEKGDLVCIQALKIYGEMLNSGKFYRCACGDDDNACERLSDMKLLEYTCLGPNIPSNVREAFKALKKK